VTSDARCRRVLLLPVEIAGWATRVQAGFAENGDHAEVLDLDGDMYGYGVRSPEDRTLQRLRSAYGRLRGLPLPLRVLSRMALLPLRVQAASAASRDRDALVVLFGRTLAFGLDLRFARRRGVRTVAVFLGGDARPPWMDGDHVNGDQPVRWAVLRLRTWLVARRVRALERLADVVVCHPSYCQFLTRPFVNWLAIAMPVDAGPEATPRTREGTVVVLHAPTRRMQKGTPQIEAAVEALRADGLDIRYEALTGLSSGEVRARLAEADVVVDQVFSDTIFAGLGSEAGVAGVLPLAFGYSAGLLAPMAAELGIPTEHFAPPEELEVRLRRAVTDPVWRAGVAARSAAYLRHESAPAAVARRLARVLDDDVPDAWWVDPARIGYVDGYGMSCELAAARLREFVRRYGETALQLPAAGAALAEVRTRLAEIDDETPGGI
jgi:hypothetical protein